MKIQIKARISGLMIFFASIALAHAENVVINNNSSAPSQPIQQCGGGNQNNIYDPRVPPAGSYVIKNSDGSSQDLYTTGEKKPYYVDSNCNQQQVAQPNVWVQPPFRRGR